MGTDGPPYLSYVDDSPCRLVWAGRVFCGDECADAHADGEGWDPLDPSPFANEAANGLRRGQLVARYGHYSRWMTNRATRGSEHGSSDTNERGQRGRERQTWATVSTSSDRPRARSSKRASWGCGRWDESTDLSTRKFRRRHGERAASVIARRGGRKVSEVGQEEGSRRSRSVSRPSEDGERGEFR